MAAVMIFIVWWSLFHKLEGYLYFYLNMTGMLFIPGILICTSLGIYWKKANSWGAYAAITLGAIPPLLYLIWPEQAKDYASALGWGGFLISLIGMIVGSLLKNLINSVKEAKIK